MIVNICDIPHKVVQIEDVFDTECHFGMIDFKKCEIRINKELTEELKTKTIYHEMVHGMLTHIGRDDLSNDEVFVQTLANAIYQGFDLKECHTFGYTSPTNG